VQDSEARPQLPRVTTGTGAGGLAAAAGSSTSSPVQRKVRGAARARVCLACAPLRWLACPRRARALRIPPMHSVWRGC